jgi:hypothetical protein
MPPKRPKNIASVPLDEATAARIDMLDIMNERSEEGQDSALEAE